MLWASRSGEKLTVQGQNIPPLCNPSEGRKQKTPVCVAPLPSNVFFFSFSLPLKPAYWPISSEYLSRGSGQVVGVQHVEVIPGAQQQATSLLVQQQRVGVEAVGGTQEQGDAANLQQLCRAQIKRLLRG